MARTENDKLVHHRTLAATDLGIGTGHSSVGDQEKARAILGVPDDHLVAFMLGVGYPAERPLTPIRKPDRRPFDVGVHHGRWRRAPAEERVTTRLVTVAGPTQVGCRMLDP